MFMAIMFSIAPRILTQRYRRMKVHGDVANMAVVIILSTRGVVGIAKMTFVISRRTHERLEEVFYSS